VQDCQVAPADTVGTAIQQQGVCDIATDASWYIGDTRVQSAGVENRLVRRL
jgi:hypothetical protein